MSHVCCVSRRWLQAKRLRSESNVSDVDSELGYESPFVDDYRSATILTGCRSNIRVIPFVSELSR